MCIKGEREYPYVQKDIYGCIYLLVCVYLEEFARNCYTTLFSREENCVAEIQGRKEAYSGCPFYSLILDHVSPLTI